MPPEKIWILRFHLSTGETEEVVHTDEASACRHFDLFEPVEPGSCAGVEMVVREGEGKKETLIGVCVFGDEG